MDPFSVASLGLGTGIQLGGAIYNATQMEKRKKEFLEQQRKIAEQTAIDHAYQLTHVRPEFFNRDAVRAQRRKNEVQEYADETFQVDPMTFVPFVGGATQFAGALYDAGKGGGQQQGGPAGLQGTWGPSSGARLSASDFLTPEELQYYRGRI